MVKHISSISTSAIGGLTCSPWLFSYAIAVERCCANALDAGARTVEVVIDMSALSACVSDDGAGIPAADFGLLGQRSCSSRTVAAAQQHKSDSREVLRGKHEVIRC